MRALGPTPGHAGAAACALATLCLLVLGLPSPSCAAVAPARPAAVTAAPGFAGRWQLAVANSDFGKSSKVPLMREDDITLDGGWLGIRSLTVREPGDTLRLTYRYRTDGDAVNTVMGQEVKTRGRRAGATQHFVSEARLFIISVTVTEQWTLSGDGARLTMVRESRSPLGSERQRLVFVRMAGAAASGRAE